jgi:hypothetical protein
VKQFGLTFAPTKLLHLPDKPAGVVNGTTTVLLAGRLALLPDKPAGGECGPDTAPVTS